MARENQQSSQLPANGMSKHTRLHQPHTNGLLPLRRPKAMHESETCKQLKQYFGQRASSDNHGDKAMHGRGQPSRGTQPSESCREHAGQLNGMPAKQSDSHATNGRVAADSIVPSQQLLSGKHAPVASTSLHNAGVSRHSSVEAGQQQQAVEADYSGRQPSECSPVHSIPSGCPRTVNTPTTEQSQPPVASSLPRPAEGLVEPQPHQLQANGRATAHPTAKLPQATAAQAVAASLATTHCSAGAAQPQSNGVPACSAGAGLPTKHSAGAGMGPVLSAFPQLANAASVALLAAQLRATQQHSQASLSRDKQRHQPQQGQVKKEPAGVTIGVLMLWRVYQLQYADADVPDHA